MPLTHVPPERQGLALTRLEGQSIVLGHDEVVITVTAIRGDKVTLSIAAPRTMAVNRAEVYRQKVQSGQL